MKRIILLLIIFAQHFPCLSQQNNYFNNEIDYLNQGNSSYSIVQTPDSGYLAVGFNGLLNPPFNNLLINKIKKDGTIEFQKSHGDNINIWVADNIISLPDKKFMCAGTFREKNLVGGNIDNKIHLTLMDANGDTVWRKFYADDTLSDNSYRMIRTSDGGFAVTGWTFKNPNMHERMMLLKVDSSGKQQFLKRYSIDTTQNNTGISLIEMPDKGFLLIGYWDTPLPNHFERLIMKIDSEGKFMWHKTYTSDDLDTYSDGLITNDDTILLVGYKTLGSGYIISPLITAIDFNGNVLWEKTYINDSTKRGNTFRIIKSNDGNFVLTGRYVPKNSLHSYAFFMKINSRGDSLWLHSFRKSSIDGWDDIFYDIKQTFDDGYILCGTTFDNTTKQDIWLVKTDCMGCDTPGCPGYEQCVTIPTNETYWNLENKLRAYPNPFENELAFSYTLAQVGETELHLYNLLGQEVSSKKISGQFGSFVLNTSSLTQGIYVCTFEQKNKVLQRGKVVKQ